MTKLSDTNSCKMREVHNLDNGYVNEGLDVSTLDITVPGGDPPHGGLKGSNEYICKFNTNPGSKTG